jgi:uncharacterized Tic20 family protein
MESQTQNTLNLQPTNQQPVHVPHEERNYGMIVHLSALAAYVLPAFGAIIGPLVAWLVLKERSSYADDQGKEALNFNISLLLYGAAAGWVVQHRHVWPGRVDRLARVGAVAHRAGGVHCAGHHRCQ